MTADDIRRAMLAAVIGTVFLPVVTHAYSLFLLLCAVSLTGYGMANYSALMQSRTIRRHFFSNAVAIVYSAA